MNNKHNIENKIHTLHDTAIKVRQLKALGKTVVLSDGTFDIIHPGIVQHLDEAKAMGEVLVVAVIRDSDVIKGPGRPVFSDELRVKSVAALEQVDLACIVDNEIPFEYVKRIDPDVFAKGQLYHERDKLIHEDIFCEKNESLFWQSKIRETNGCSFSSSEIINNFIDIYPEDTKQFIQNFADKYELDDIIEKIKALNDLDVLLIGDGIIDEYHYCSSLGKSAKAHLLVSKYLSHEIFAGGAFAIANHLSSICKRVKLVTLLGNEDKREEFINRNIRSTVEPKYFYRKDGPSIIKKRYVDQYLNQKIFEINYLNDNYINGECESEVLDYLSKELPKYDLVLVSDFGHGFITKKIIKAIEKHSKKVAVNTQTNAANMGFNVITKYSSPNIVCLDEVEARLTMQNRFDNIEMVVKELFYKINSEILIVTLGKRGSIGISKNSDVSHAPIFSSKIVDTVGAGDAVFSYVAACSAKNYPLDFITFIGNAVGAIAVQIVCNKESVERYELLEFMNTLFKINGMKHKNLTNIERLGPINKIIAEKEKHKKNLEDGKTIKGNAKNTVKDLAN